MSKVEAGITPEQVSNTGKTILIADNFTPDRRKANGILKHFGFESFEAGTWNHLIDMSRDNQVGLIVVDPTNMVDQENVGKLGKPYIITKYLKGDLHDRDIHNETESRIVALNQGADYFLPKPLEPVLFATLVNSSLAREAAPTILKGQNEMTIDLENRRLMFGSSKVKLGRVEWKFIEILARSASGVVSQEELLLRILGEESVQDNYYCLVQISMIRKKMEDVSPGFSQVLKTVPWRGYVLEAHKSA